MGWSIRHGWYEGFRLLSAVTPQGVITGFRFGPASVNHHLLVETFFALRAHEELRSQRTIMEGRGAERLYPADSRYVGQARATQLRASCGASVVAPPQRNQLPRGWTPEVRGWTSRLRHFIETVYGRLSHTRRLEEERPTRFRATKCDWLPAWPCTTSCLLLNRQLGRANLAFTDLIGWRAFQPAGPADGQRPRGGCSTAAFGGSASRTIGGMIPRRSNGRWMRARRTTITSGSTAA